MFRKRPRALLRPIFQELLISLLGPPFQDLKALLYKDAPLPLLRPIFQEHTPLQKPPHLVLLPT